MRETLGKAKTRKADMDERSILYRRIAERLWRPCELLSGAEGC